MVKKTYVGYRMHGSNNSDDLSIWWDRPNMALAPLYAWLPITALKPTRKQKGINQKWWKRFPEHDKNDTPIFSSKVMVAIADSRTICRH